MQLKNFIVFTLLFCSISLFAQATWQLEQELAPFTETRKNIQQFQIANLNTSEFLQDLLATPEEFSGNYQRIYLPMPDASLQAFDIAVSSIMEEGLAQKYPHFQTYVGHAIDNKSMSMRCAWTSMGFHAYILSSEGDIFIDPFEKENQYIIYYGKHEIGGSMPEKACGFMNAQHSSISKDDVHTPVQYGEQLRLIRTAIATTGEYTQERGNGNTETGLASVVRITNSLNVIFERDLGVRLLLIADNDRLIYTDSDNDPYDIDAFSMLQQNRMNLNETIGRDNYDLGHVLGFALEGGVGGVASFVGNFCTEQTASGVSGYFDNEARLIRTVAHEIGHQLGADHTWSNCGEDLNSGQRSSNTAVEPGSGSTIMSYAGSCAENDVIRTSYPFFHGMSIRQINNRLDETGQCYDLMETGNNVPTVSIASPSGLRIPISTPFELTVNASDSDGDELTYSWEQFDLGPISPLGSPIGNGPSFRAFQPTELDTRVFPNRITIQFNREDNNEVLPTFSRGFTFQAVVRDNRNGGGIVVLEPTNFSSSEMAGPFKMLSPNEEDVILSEGEDIEVTWDVANTDMPPINCETVDILLSYNNGFSYPDTLAHAVPNTGSASIIIPVGRTATRTRLKVKATNSIFFDISDNYFPIVEAMVAVDETTAANGLNILPNPAKDKLWVEVEETSAAPMDLMLYNTQGKLLKNYRFSTFGKRQVLDISEIEAGVYYLKSMQEGKQGVRKVVIQ